MHARDVIVVWVVAVAAGFGAAIVASRRAVVHAAAIIESTRLPPFFIGITLMALGTDLPEIANSIVASATGHGDVNVGDSIGSTVTQMTLVLGILPLVAGAFGVGPRRIVAPGAVILVGLAAVAFVAGDGELSRADGFGLVVLWAVGSAVVFGLGPPASGPAMQAPSLHLVRHGAIALAMLAVVGAGAGLALRGIVGIAEVAGVPEFVVAFFLASIGTSLPELVVDLTAIRDRQRDLAVGDAVGSSLVDTTLSIGIGPLLFPVAVTASFAVEASLAAMAAVAIVVALLATRRRHGRITGAVLVLVYLAFYPILLA